MLTHSRQQQRRSSSSSKRSGRTRANHLLKMPAVDSGMLQQVVPVPLVPVNPEDAVESPVFQAEERPCEVRGSPDHDVNFVERVYPKFLQGSDECCECDAVWASAIEGLSIV